MFCSDGSDTKPTPSVQQKEKNKNEVLKANKMESKSADHETKAERLKLIQFAPCGDCSTEDLPQALCHLHFFKMDQLEQLIKRVSEDNL